MQELPHKEDKLKSRSEELKWLKMHNFWKHLENNMHAKQMNLKYRVKTFGTTPEGAHRECQVTFRKAQQLQVMRLSLMRSHVRTIIEL